MTWTILRLFVNTATAYDDKYPVLSRGNLKELIQMHLSEKQNKKILKCFVHFFNLNQILNILKEK